MTNPDLWQRCLSRLEAELTAQQFNTWIRPLHAEQEGDSLRLLAPNRYVKEWVEKHFLDRVVDLAGDFTAAPVGVTVGVGSQPRTDQRPDPVLAARGPRPTARPYAGGLNPEFTFENHVEGKSNQIARAAARQVGENPGKGYNPLFIYGGVGLGKTHLMQAAGNAILARNPAARVAYVHSERFVSDMVKALQHNAIEDFKRHYRSLDALLIDDVQFFSGKGHSQEEFFHTFNTLLETQRQVIMTSDRFPKEISGVEERLISRFGSGLTVSIDPPELETRVAILRKKAASQQVELPEEVGFFVARQISSNIRELEGALHRIVAGARFTGRGIDIDLATEALKDLLIFQERQVTVPNIQKRVAEYYKIRVSDLSSKRRNRQIARPRQMAMALAKELTVLSLPEIGEAFGGRDHTTVIHACKKIKELKETDPQTREDYANLRKILTS